MTNPPNDSDAVGVIIPPSEVRDILDTTASYVAKKPAFEALIIQRRQNDPKFSFLYPSDPYHTYYRQLITDKRQHLAPHHAPPPPPSNPQAPNPQATLDTPPPNSDPTDFAAAQSQADGDAPNTTHRAPTISLIRTIKAKAHAARAEPTEPPPDDIFSLPLMRPPPPALPLDVMKLAAQHVAQHGPAFLSSLSQKESRNSLFDFLKPMHPHFVAFQHLVNAYRRVLHQGHDKKEMLARLAELAESPDALLNDVWYIHDWECQTAEREHEAGLDEKEKVRLAQIDWHDFVVVSTIDFEDHDDHLPAPVEDAHQLPKMLAAARKAHHEREKNRQNVDMEIDLDAPAPPAAPTASPVPTAVAAAAAPNDMPRVQMPKGARVDLVNVDTDIPADRIRLEAPAPSAGKEAPPLRGRAAPTSEPTITLPSGQRVPLSKAEASVRAELIDPSYKHERERAAERNRRVNLAPGDEVARNLAKWDQEHKEGGVYNRADLQQAVSRRRLASSVEANGSAAEASATGVRVTGPELPAMEAGDADGVGEEPAVKRARTEAAVVALSKNKRSKEIRDVEEVEDGDGDSDVLEKADGGRLLSGEDWLKKQGDKAKVRIKVTKHSNKEWKLEGQEIQLAVPLKSTVTKLKNWIAKNTKLPANKQKLQIDSIGFLRDSKTLASYNVGDASIITLEVKERGGRKKH